MLQYTHNIMNTDVSVMWDPPQKPQWRQNDTLNHLGETLSREKESYKGTLLVVINAAVVFINQAHTKPQVHG